MAGRQTNVYRVSVRGAGRRASEFDRLARAIQDELVRELRAFGRAAELIFREEAPEDTGQLQEAIRAVPFFGRAMRPRVSIGVDPIRGHGGDQRSYLDVTRYGHRKRTITPRRGRALKVHLEGHRNAQIFVFRASVSGVPAVENSRWAGNWTIPAAERAERLAAASERRLSRRIDSRVLR